MTPRQYDRRGVREPAEYLALLQGTRALEAEDARTRDVWFQKLQQAQKLERLFEFETLLKGTACFANPRNHGGPRAQLPLAAQNFAPHARIARGAFIRLQTLAAEIGAATDRAPAFRRHLDLSLPTDSFVGARVRVPPTPDEDLVALRQGFICADELASALDGNVAYRTFFALLGTTQRNVASSRFFNSLSALEFRTEYDRLPSAEVLALIEGLGGSESRKLVALALLSCFRLLRYLSLIEHTLANATTPDQTIGTVLFVWSVFRSDTRALCTRMLDHAGALLVRDYAKTLQALHARDVGPRFAELLAEAHALRDLRIALEGSSASVRLEVKRAFEYDLPAPSDTLSLESLRERSTLASRALRAAIQNAVLAIGTSLGVRLDECGVFDARSDRMAMSERLRRDLWMFAQVLRAFCEKAGEVSAMTEHWLEPSPFIFVSHFLSYFRSMGYPLIRAADYPRIDPFLSAVETIRDAHYVDADRLAAVRDEALEFREYLLELFESVSKREELQEMPFDRKAAATTLRLYLGSA